MTVVPHIRTLLPDGSLPAESQAFVSQQVQQEAGQFVTDAQAAQAAAEAARDAALAAVPHIIVGAGRPDIVGTLDPDIATRVNTAPPGAVFRSTDGPQGAWEWMKQGTSWAVTQGDTRFRDISSALAQGWEGRVDIARIGRTVDVFVYELAGTGASTDDFLSIPLGYRPRYRTSPFESWLVSSRSLSGTPTVRRIGAFGTYLRMYGRDVADGMTGHLTFFTDDAWPTAIPA